MADDDPRPLFDPRLFAPSEFIGDDMEHNVDVTGATSVDVNHTLDVDLPLRRIERGVVAFALLVVFLGVFTPLSTAVQVCAAAAVVLVGNALLR